MVDGLFDETFNPGMGAYIDPPPPPTLAPNMGILVGGGGKCAALGIVNPPISIPGGNPIPPLLMAICVSACNWMGNKY